MITGPTTQLKGTGSKRKGEYSYHWHTNGYNISFDEALSVYQK